MHLDGNYQPRQCESVCVIMAKCAHGGTFCSWNHHRGSFWGRYWLFICLSVCLQADLSHNSDVAKVTKLNRHVGRVKRNAEVADWCDQCVAVGLVFLWRVCNADKCENDTATLYSVQKYEKSVNCCRFECANTWRGNFVSAIRTITQGF